MRRAVIGRQGPPEVFEVVRAPDPRPADGEVLVEVAAAGVNVTDLYQRSGAYRVALPFTPGMEGSGVVLRVGAGVSGVAEGDRVAWAGSPNSYASRCAVAARRLVPVPDGVRLADAAAVLIQGMTAHMLVTDAAPLGPDDTCLVHAAAGGVGGLLCQLAARSGARVIGTVSDPAKEGSAREAGAQYVIDYRAGRFAEQVMEITGGRGVDVVFDAVGRDTFEQGLTCLRPRGMFVLYGQTSGPAAPIDPQVLAAGGSLFLTKASLAHYDPERADLLRRAAIVFGEVEAERLQVRTHGVYDLEDVAAAHRALESRSTRGKVLLRL